MSVWFERLDKAIPKGMLSLGGMSLSVEPVAFVLVKELTSKRVPGPIKRIGDHHCHRRSKDAGNEVEQPSTCLSNGRMI
jgi:hypothetical protein